MLAPGGDLLEHGSHSRELGSHAWLEVPPGTAIVVLAETYWNPEDPPEGDAKHVVRRLLGQRDIVCQFLNSNWEPKKPRSFKRSEPATGEPPAADVAVDHPAIGAVRDLLRQAGVVDDRLGRALVKGGRSLLDRPAILVGIHIRQNTPRRKNGQKPPNSLVVRLTALHTEIDADQPWRLASGNGPSSPWLSYREGNASYYASPIGIGDLSRTARDREAVQTFVDRSLEAVSFPKDRPLVLFVDAESCKGVWPGLNDASLGDGPLPGDTISHPDVAVVRCASGSRVPQATHRGHGGTVADPHQPPLPQMTVYEHDEAGTLSWVLTQASKTYRGKTIDAKAGAKYTRWTVPTGKEKLNSDDWHALSMIEITVPKPGSWQPHVLAELTARLCHQAASWDDRTKKPVPLHLAERSDLDHPQRNDDDAGSAEMQ